MPVHNGLYAAVDVDDIDSSSWINLGVGRAQGAFDIADSVLTVDRFPFNAEEPLLHAFSVFVAPQPSLAPPIRFNATELHPVNTLIKDRYQQLPWRGNVLVVRHDRHGVADVRLEDIALIDVIVKRWG